MVTPLPWKNTIRQRDRKASVCALNPQPQRQAPKSPFLGKGISRVAELAVAATGTSSETWSHPRDVEAWILTLVYAIAA